MAEEVRREARWIENAPSSSWFEAPEWRELWARRDLALLFGWRELKLRYKQTVVGVAWVVLQPLLAMALFTILLETGVSIPSEGIPYPVFAYIGLAVWTAFAAAVTRSSEIFVQDPNLLGNVYFPRLLGPLGVVLPAAVDAAIALAVGAVLMAAYGVAPPPAIVLLPLCIVWMLVLAAAVGTLLSALNVIYRDVRYAMAFAIQIWLFATPVFYASSLIDGDARLLLFLNPASGLIEAVRATILGTPIDVAGEAISLVTLALVAVAGILYFQRVERRLADRV